jgi:hypothetical protein
MQLLARETNLCERFAWQLVPTGFVTEGLRLLHLNVSCLVR